MTWRDRYQRVDFGRWERRASAVLFVSIIVRLFFG